MNPSKASKTETKAIRPLKKTINSAAARSEDAAKEVEETEGGERDQEFQPRQKGERPPPEPEGED